MNIQNWNRIVQLNPIGYCMPHDNNSLETNFPFSSGELSISRMRGLLGEANRQITVNWSVGKFSGFDETIGQSLGSLPFLARPSNSMFKNATLPAAR